MIVGQYNNDLIAHFGSNSLSLNYQRGGGDHSRGPLILFPPSVRPCLMYIVYLPTLVPPPLSAFLARRLRYRLPVSSADGNRWHCRTVTWTKPSIAPDTNCSSSRSQQQRQPPSLPRSSVLLFSPKKKCLNVSGGREEQASPS